MQPDSCICPTESYWCRADLVTAIAIEKGDLSFAYAAGFSNERQVTEGLRVSFSEVGEMNGLANITAQLFIIDQQRWNRTNFSCRATSGDPKNISVCITGKTLFHLSLCNVDSVRLVSFCNHLVKGGLETSGFWLYPRTCTCTCVCFS